ncbi:MAG: helix-turn-helix domain-containing protein [Isosphaeraceae bacterium]
MTLLTYREAAARIGLSIPSLTRLVKAGKIPSHRIGPAGGCVRFSPEDLDRYLERCRKVGAK